LWRTKYITIVFDKIVEGGCSRRRPDVRIDMGSHIIIVECDEDQHKGYSCENKRMMEIFQNCGNRPIVFIRFNPDSYTKNMIKYFKTTGNGLVVNLRKEWSVISITIDYINQKKN
jgi:hypothetical protein